VITRPGKAAVDASLFAQVVGLMVGGLIVALMINLILLQGLFGVPPPQPEIHLSGEIGRALMGVPPAEGRPLLVVEKGVKSPGRNQPVTAYGAGLRREIVASLVKNGGPDVDPTRIVIYSASTKWFPRGRTIALLPRGIVLPPGAQNERWIVAPFTIALPYPDGTWTVVKDSPRFKLDSWQRRILISFLATAIVLAVGAYLFARRLTWPFAVLAAGAERLGRDPRAPPLPVTGASEVRVAARAFNDMQERLRRYVDDRTAMIGAIAHDLRTPLTRLRFRVEGVPEDLRAKMSSDLDQMEAMISATLGFVRDATEEGQRDRLELSSLLESLADDMTDTGADVTIERADKVIIHGDPVALKRLFSNLLVNAVKYGKRARVRVYAEPDAAIIEVDDDGPGVPNAEMERVFEPFYRREPSRNRDTGGIGLGLAVVRSISRAHGGDTELDNRPGGGLTARVRLPL
jgi:two-component system OmpR family sensor kinase